MLVSVKIYNNIFRHYNQTLGRCQQDKVTTQGICILSRSLMFISFYRLKFRVTTQWTHTDHGSSQSYHGHPMAHCDCGATTGFMTMLVMYSQFSEGKPYNTTKF